MNSGEACSISQLSGIECGMIELKLKRTALRWDFSFFAVLAVFFWLDSSGFGLAALLLCAAHELAHLAVMRLLSITPESVTFYGAGIRISAPETESRSLSEQAAVYSAGCTMNFLLAGIMYALPDVGITGMQYLDKVGTVSLFTGLFNLLPLGEFDGRRLLKLLFIAVLKPENIDTALRISGILSAVICAAAVIAFGRGAGFTLMTTALYLLLMSLRRV